MGKSRKSSVDKEREEREAEVAGEVIEGSVTLKMRGTRKAGNMSRGDDGVVEIMGTEREGERVGQRERE